MLSHAQIWQAIDRLAAARNMTASGLARAAGLDPTTFNRSKRMSAAGKARWPSTESLAKILEATGTSFDEFVRLVDDTVRRELRRIPVIGLAQAGSAGYFDDGGFPVGTGWEEVAFPDIEDANAYALEVSGDSMLPLFRDGDTVIVSPVEQVRRGDRVVVKTVDGEVMIKQLARRTARHVELVSLNPSFPTRMIETKDVLWIARIIWASQ